MDRREFFSLLLGAPIAVGSKASFEITDFDGPNQQGLLAVADFPFEIDLSPGAINRAYPGVRLLPGGVFVIDD